MRDREDFHVVSRVGTLLMTFDSADLARAWAKRRAADFPGVRVERVTTWVDRQVVYRAARQPYRQAQKECAA